MSIFGNKVRQLRFKRNMTQLQLAKIIGVDATMISKIETGESNGSLQTIRNLANALDVSLIELLDETTPNIGDSLDFASSKNLC